MLLWIALLSFTAYKGVHLPVGHEDDTLTIFLMVTAKLLFVTIALRLMEGLDGLTISVSALLIAACVYWLGLMAVWLWPIYFLSHPNFVTYLRYVIAVTSIWMVFELIRNAGVNRKTRGVGRIWGERTET